MAMDPITSLLTGMLRVAKGTLSVTLGPGGYLIAVGVVAVLLWGLTRWRQGR